MPKEEVCALGEMEDSVPAGPKPIIEPSELQTIARPRFVPTTWLLSLRLGTGCHAGDQVATLLDELAKTNPRANPG